MLTDTAAAKTNNVCQIKLTWKMICKKNLKREYDLLEFPECQEIPVRHYLPNSTITAVYYSQTCQRRGGHSSEGLSPTRPEQFQHSAPDPSGALILCGWDWSTYLKTLPFPMLSYPARFGSATWHSMSMHRGIQNFRPSLSTYHTSYCYSANRYNITPVEENIILPYYYYYY